MHIEKKPYDYLIKLLLLGDSSVGKSSLLLRYADNTFSDNFITTIGIDFKLKTLNVDGKLVRLQIWDAAGQERFRTITTAYYRGAQGILLVYDVTDQASFTHIQSWIDDIRSHSGRNDLNMMLIGNKCDLGTSKVVDSVQGKEFALKANLKFYETSAKENSAMVEDIFLQMVKDIIKNKEQDTSIKQSLKLEVQTQKKSDCCK